MKASEIREMSNDDLKDKLAVLVSETEKLTINHAISPLENPLQLRAIRKDIARLKTELQKRTLEAAK